MSKKYRIIPDLEFYTKDPIWNLQVKKGLFWVTIFSGTSQRTRERKNHLLSPPKIYTDKNNKENE